MEKTILLLIGPKGAGKTYLGSRLEREVAIPFVRVEPIWLDLAGTQRLSGASYDAVGQERVLAAVESGLRSSPCVALESTGTAPWFPSFFEKLPSLGRVVAIRVRAPTDVCLARVRGRQYSEHIAISDDRVREINVIAERVQFDWSFVIDNNSQSDADSFVDLIRMHKFS